MFEKYEYAEITIEELADIHPSLYRFCDVRDEVSYRYGSIPKAENISNIVELAEEGWTWRMSFVGWDTMP